MLVNEAALDVKELFADLASRTCHSGNARGVEVFAQALQLLNLVAFQEFDDA